MKQKLINLWQRAMQNPAVDAGARAHIEALLADEYRHTKTPHRRALQRAA